MCKIDEKRERYNMWVKIQGKGKVISSDAGYKAYERVNMQLNSFLILAGR